MFTITTVYGNLLCETLPNGYLQVSFRYSRKLVELIKSCEKAHWEKPYWFVLDSGRTRFTLFHVMRNSPWFNHWWEKSPKLPTTKYPLYAPQHEDYEILMFKRRCVYAAEMGYGKTIVLFAVLEELQGPIWWVGGKDSIQALKQEIMKWRPSIHFDVIVTYDSLNKELLQAENPPKVVVFDESTAVKTPTSKRSRTALALVENMETKWGEDTYVYLLTGTPAPKNYLDWWSQIEICQPGFLKEKNIWKFRERLAVLFTDSNGAGQEYTKISSWKEEEITCLPKRLSPIVIRRLKSELETNIPPKEYHEIEIPLNKETYEAAMLVVSEELNAAQVLNQLRQMSDGFLYKEEKVIEFETPKDAQLKAFLRRKDINRLIIYAAYRASIDKVTTIMSLLGWQVFRIDGRGWKVLPFSERYMNLIDCFQNKLDFPEKIVIVAHPQSAGRGVTLTASEDIIYYSNTFKGEDRMQSEDRFHRHGATACNIWDFIHFPTDRMVLSNVKKKRDTQDITLAQIKSVFENTVVEDNHDNGKQA